MMITQAMVDELDAASRSLIEAVVTAVAEFHSRLKPVSDSQHYPSRSNAPWEVRAIPNLHNYQTALDAAALRFKSGDWRAIYNVAAAYVGISKDMDFDNSWMTSDDRVSLEKAIDRVVSIADSINRIGYAKSHP